MKAKKQNIKVALDFLTFEDYADLKTVMITSYDTMRDSYWQEGHIRKLLSIFPDGQVVIKVNGQIAGCALSIIVDYDQFGEDHTYREITGDHTFSTHTMDGDTLYGIDVFVKPEFRGMRLGRRLYEYRKELCEKLNLKSIIFGGRIPNYHNYADKLTPKAYIEQVKAKKIHDPVLNFQMSNDFQPIRVLKGYLDGDDASKEYAVLLKWSNIYYERKGKKPIIHKSEIRLGLVQWQMRPYKHVDEIMEQVEYFIDALAGYKSDFALFPEFFNAPLMAQYNHMSEAQAIRKMAGFTTDIIVEFSKLSVTYNINIITGSMPELVDDTLYNAGYICRRDGTIERYEKLHVTPDEARVWALKGGNELKVFDTDCGKIGVLICYDVEFPELGRLLAEQGMQILFVPFLTDTQNGYARVKNCAHARAIENECYVAIAGCVGNLPNVNNMDIQYAQSMVFTPCDFSFPINGVKSETTPNTEMILISDVNIDHLRELHSHGSVRNLLDRRKDIFELVRKK